MRDGSLRPRKGLGLDIKDLDLNLHKINVASPQNPVSHCQNWTSDEQRTNKDRTKAFARRSMTKQMRRFDVVSRV
jgi:hypothetical protein